MDILWSMTTTIRNPDRIPGFLKTAKEIENEEWNSETQKKFQILLIKNRYYLDGCDTQTYKKLNDEQIKILQNKQHKMSYAEAKDIFDTKEYDDPPMRGRQSMSPLEKLGLIDKSEGVIRFTDVGNKLYNDEITYGEFLFSALLKLQYPNMTENERQEWNTKPFINTLKLIKKVNELCRESNMKEKGLTKIEFGIFALSLKNYNDVDVVAQKVIEFRRQYENINTKAEKDIFRKAYINEYLNTFNNPMKNTTEYTDNIIRYMHITNYIHIRGKYDNGCIDLEPRRMVEINSILENDNGSAREFTIEEWKKYFSTYNSYELPFETNEKLVEIFNNLINDINNIKLKLDLPIKEYTAPSHKKEIKQKIEELRKERLRLQNLEIKFDYDNDLLLINTVIDSLLNIKKLMMKPSIALEKWANIALNIINDSIVIKPNSPLGDDNEPRFTAPGGVPDIECFYRDFNAICEVTTLCSRDQWYNEGQPVMAHLRKFETLYNDKPAYCLFIAPSLHDGTLSTYYNSVKFEYDGKPQRIIPVTIKQLIKILQVVMLYKENQVEFKSSYMKDLYDKVVEAAHLNSGFSAWKDSIPAILKEWEFKMEKIINQSLNVYRR